MITQIAAVMTAQIPPHKTPSTGPNHDLGDDPARNAANRDGRGHAPVETNANRAQDRH